MNFSTNAKFALVIAEPPVDDLAVAPRQIWTNFLYNIRQRERSTKGIEKIHENVWLIDLKTDMKFLGELFEWYSSGIRLRMLFLDEKPDWIQYPPAAEEKPSQATP